MKNELNLTKHHNNEKYYFKYFYNFKKNEKRIFFQIRNHQQKVGNIKKNENH